MSGIHRSQVDSPHKGSIMWKALRILGVITLCMFCHFIQFPTSWLSITNSKSAIRSHMTYDNTQKTQIISHTITLRPGHVRSRIVQRCRVPIFLFKVLVTLEWRHIERDAVSNHQRLAYLPDRLFRRRSKFRVMSILWGEFTGDRWIPHTKMKILPFDDVIMIWLYRYFAVATLFST